jgi:CBS-domain-containing membrane protein
MNVASVMTTRVTTATPETRVRELWRLLFVKHINSIPVVDKENLLLGLITKEDLLKGLYPDYQEYFVDATGVADFEVMENKVKEMGNTKAQELMNTRVIFTREATPMMRALSRMIVRSLDQLPVLSDNDEVIGMVTKGDIFYALFKKSIKKATGGEKMVAKKHKKAKNR